MHYNIGIIDSGIGGLTVLQNLREVLPHENYVYIGDNKHCPYGEKTKEELLSYATAIINYFISINVNLVVIACNTINSNIMPELLEKYPNIKIIGIIKGTINNFINSKPKKALIIATPKTIESRFYEQSIRDINEDINLYTKATPLLVPMIENNNSDIINTLHTYLDEYKNNIDTILLGCTHYPIVKNKIKDILGNINVISSSEGATDEVCKYIGIPSKEGGSVVIYTTGDIETFVNSSETFFNYNNISVRKLDL